MCVDHAAVLRELRKVERGIVEAYRRYNVKVGEPCPPTEVGLKRMVQTAATHFTNTFILNTDFFKAAHDLEDDPEYVEWRTGVLMDEIGHGPEHKN